MRTRIPWCILIAILFSMAAPVFAQPEERTAVFVEIQGNVTVAEATPPSRGGPRLAAVHRAQHLQAAKAGDKVHLPRGAAVGLVCSNDRWIEITGPREQRLTERLCLVGKALPPGTYRRLAPAAGRMRSLGLAQILAGETRGLEDEDFAVPVLVSPRHTAVLDGRPTFRWTPISGAVEYEIEITGRVQFRFRLKAKQASCGERWGDTVVCSLPYPGQEQELPPGEVSFLSVGARRDLAGTWRKESKPSRVQRLPAMRAAEVQAELGRLRGLPLDHAAREILAADLYARKGLLADAIAAYQRTMALRDAAALQVTLADAYLRTGLLRMAARGYQNARDGSSDRAVQAGAELGLGEVERARRNGEAALAHFRRARDLYAELALDEERAVAEHVIKKLEETRPE